MTRCILRTADTALGLAGLVSRAARLYAQQAAVSSIPQRQSQVIPTKTSPYSFELARATDEPALPLSTALEFKSAALTEKDALFAHERTNLASKKANLDDSHEQTVSPNNRPLADATLSSFEHDPLTVSYPDVARTTLRSSRVPSSRLARLMQYGNLAAGMGIGAASAAIRSLSPGAKGERLVLNQANINRMVRTLSKMRGAALKLGQFLSIQESKALPPELESLFTSLQNAADYMPEWQTREVLTSQLGPDWLDRFTHFEMVPFASASIGQVHTGITKEGVKVAVKIQFPGVADSIESDIANLKMLLSLSAVLPKGLFLDNTLRVMKRELVDECDYRREAEFGQIFASALRNDPDFRVPAVIESLSGAKVLTTEFMSGIPLKTVEDLNQADKDHIGTTLIRLCLKELFEMRCMQTDPNWSNFLWDRLARQLQLIDFGASQQYSKDFMRCYKDLLQSAVRMDRAACIRLSKQIGYLTDADTLVMVNAHVDTMLALGEPFRQSEPFDFSRQDLAAQVRAQIPTMLEHRKVPPPQETYSLNRKLSGCFLLCSKLGSRVGCRNLLKEHMLL